MAQINTRIILRNDSTSNWLLNENVVLLKGEVGIEFLSDSSCKVKIGDGVKSWKDLPYFGEDHLIGDDETIVVEGKVIHLKGFKEAQNGAHLVKNANGELAWEVPSNDLELKVEDLIFDLKDLSDEFNKEVQTRENADNDIKALIGLVSERVDAEVDAREKSDAALTKEIGETKTSLLNELEKTETKLTKKIEDTEESIRILTEGIDPEKIDGVKDLIDYVDQHGSDFSGVISKLDTIEEGAQVNILEDLFVAGEKLDITDKKAEIPVASLEKHGVVKSATGPNKVNVAKDGTMSVNKVDVNSLVVPMGEEFVLNGGNAVGSGIVYAASVGNIGYASVEEAMKNLDNGAVVALQSDLIMGTKDTDHLAIGADDVTINLNDHVFVANGSNGAIKVEGGMTTLEGAGAVSATLGSDNYSMAVWADAGKVVINDGVYSNVTDGSDRGTDLIYASGTGVIEINGGKFEAATPEWTLNVKDADHKAGTARIIVKGGSFKNFDPANCKAEGEGTNFVATGYQSVKEGDYYVVKHL